MAHTSFGRRGRFCPTRRPLSHATREEALLILISVDMVDLHARPLPPQRRRSAGRPSYRNRTELREPCSAEQTVSGGKPSMSLRRGCLKQATNASVRTRANVAKLIRRRFLARRRGAQFAKKHLAQRFP